VAEGLGIRMIRFVCRVNRLVGCLALAAFPLALTGCQQSVGQSSESADTDSAVTTQSRVVADQGPPALSSGAPVDAERSSDESRVAKKAPPADEKDDTKKKGDAEKKPAEDEEPLLLDDEPPLLLDDEPPLLLDDEGNEPATMADNSRCHVCHLNFAQEKIAVVHARANIGCAKCHGDCDEHIADESWADGGPGTPPGVMFPPDKIDSACGKCHRAHDVAATDVIRCWLDRYPKQPVPKTVVCTDCHGHHRLDAELRKAWWDKATGKPIKAPKANDSGKPVG